MVAAVLPGFTGVDVLRGIWPWAGPTPLPLFPTPTPSRSQDAEVITHTAVLADLLPPDFVFPRAEQARLGVSLPMGATTAYDFHAFGIGWVMDWRARAAPQLPEGVAYAQTVRMTEGALVPDAETLMVVAATLPGSLWLISNEGDVRWQDNITPTAYAQLYHEAYLAIKAGDPMAVVAVGGIAQPTPLRLRYLDQVLGAYQMTYGAPLPTQAWHIHNYMLREERNSWGVDIPPGIPDDTGVLYEIDDSGNLDAFRRQIYDFRRWMAERGYRDTPLIISEYGITMPPDYGFPLERVADFLWETWRFFLTATDPEIGYPDDGGRLVQQWCWFSLDDQIYPTGDLVNADTGTWTPLGAVWYASIE